MLSHSLILFSARSAAAEKTPKKTKKLNVCWACATDSLAYGQRARNFF